jgi:sec-independent protein translocase protein TatC
MPLVEHLRELRNRLVKALLAIVPLTILALFFAKDIAEFVSAPVPSCASEAEAAAQSGRCAVLSQVGLTSPFTTLMKVSLVAAVIAATPVWLYQLWAFVAPGLHKNEKKYALTVVSVGTPLFLLGAFLARWILPYAVRTLLGFSIDGSVSYITVDNMIDISLKLTLAFGLAFQLPVVLCLLNVGGVVSGRRMLGWWRAMVMIIAVFSAIVTPTDPMSMIALAVPMTALYFAAVAFSLFNDRRRARAGDSELSDDEASDLNLTPEGIGEVEPVSAARALPASVDSDGDRVNGYDDVT